MWRDVAIPKKSLISTISVIATTLKTLHPKLKLGLARSASRLAMSSCEYYYSNVMGTELDRKLGSSRALKEVQER